MEQPHNQASYLSLVESCDNFPFGPPDESYYSLYLPRDDQPHGYMLPETVRKIPWTSDFVIDHGCPRSVTVLDTSRGADTAKAVNAAFAKIVSICIERDIFHVLCRRHSELFPIVSAQYSESVSIERFAAQLFGVIHRGAYLVAFSNTDHGMMLWIARRGMDLYTYPGMLDVTVAGGIKSGASPMDTVIAEAAEEASLSGAIIRKGVRSRGLISEMSVTGKGFPGEQGLVVPGYSFVYDIELPPNVKPKPNDDEVDNFTCMTVLEVQDALLAGEFKPDSGSVMVHFLIVHGFITPDNEKDFVDINGRLHRRLPFRTRSA